jgi:hypothetical protein
VWGLKEVIDCFVSAFAAGTLIDIGDVMSHVRNWQPFIFLGCFD